MARNRSGKADTTPCQWISELEAFKRFATHADGTQSARHIKPLHWYIACRLVLEGGFDPEEITPRPPFAVTRRRGRKAGFVLSYAPHLAGTGEQVVLGGLKTKNVDVVVSKHHIGPVMAVSCKGMTKAFRNLTNRMEETIGECTNLHITYPAMVLGYFAVLRANRTAQDVREAPEIDDNLEDEEPDESQPPTLEGAGEQMPPRKEQVNANDIAILDDGTPTDSIIRFHAALCEMTLRHGIRDEISRYEAMTLALIEPKGDTAGSVFPAFPPEKSPLRLDRFFQTLYQRYEERFVYGAPLLADRGTTPRLVWTDDSPVFGEAEARQLGFLPRRGSV